MKKKLALIVSLSFLTLFIIFTVLVKVIDVQPIGAEKDGVISSVGFASMNGWYKNLINVNFIFYKITDYSSFLAVIIGFVFLITGIYEWVKRKNFWQVDANILALGFFYIFTFASYVLFQFLVINYRPVLIDGQLEASYPSSTTVLSLTFFITAADQIKIYIKNNKLKYALIIFTYLFSLFLIVGRLLSGVHWLSDIIAALILSSALVFSYYALKSAIRQSQISTK